MAACNVVQVVNPSVLSRIESFMNDTSYRDAIENSATYNTRLCIERRLRMPFLDSQTGVAQNHSALFMSPRERLPGLSEGQVYTYPSRRWRKRRRQYLMQPQVSPRVLQRREAVDPATDGDLHTISTVENPAVVSMSGGSGGGGSGGGGGSVGGGSSCGGGEDSKESIKEEAPKVSEAWFYDELDLHAMDGFDEPDPDSDYDYEESYSKRKKKRASAPKPSRSSTTPSEAPTPKRSKAPGPGRGRKKGVNYSELTDADKPFACELCGARYKTRPGLTYHYTHSHKDRGMVAVGVGVSMGPSEEEISCESSCTSMICPGSPPTKDTGTLATGLGPVQGWSKFQDSYLTFLNAPGGSSSKKSRSSRSGGGGSDGGGAGPSVAPPPVPIEEVVTPMSPPPPALHERKLPMQEEQVLVMEQNEKERAVPSPYCDFCLGDAVANKKSGQPEELVSCSDCGRSGHPTCLQFTDNMIISVRKYRWQCIECKCCSICGTSDNDDQLLFCDDCDRGYHMYCLAPPLHTPPEGSWSCRLCILEFHSK